MIISLNVYANWLIIMDTFRRKLKSHETTNLFECVFIIYLTGKSKIYPYMEEIFKKRNGTVRIMQ